MFWIKPMHRLRGKRQEAVLSVTVSQGDAHRRLPCLVRSRGFQKGRTVIILAALCACGRSSSLVSSGSPTVTAQVPSSLLAAGPGGPRGPPQLSEGVPGSECLQRPSAHLCKS